MTFDPFRDFETRGYLRNFEGCKDIEIVKANENIAFLTNLDTAITNLVMVSFIEYKHVLATHRTLFGDIYPWAGEDRLATSPDINISKAGYSNMFANPISIRRATEYALQQGQDRTLMRERPGTVMGALAHAHPFLDGNGRTIMTLHTEMAYRAGIEINWTQTNKTEYLEALTQELYQPERGHLDLYLQPFIIPCTNRVAPFATLRTLKGLGNTANLSQTNQRSAPDSLEERLKNELKANGANENSDNDPDPSEGLDFESSDRPSSSSPKL
jgi:cell filamentation protein